MSHLGEWLARLRLTLAGADFEVRGGPGQPPKVRGALPRAKVGEIAAFAGAHLPSSRSWRIRGRRVRPGTWRFWFSGALAPGERQKARNFLMEHLR